MRASLITLLLVGLAGCNDATSGNLTQVPFSVGGPAYADGGPLLFTTANGWNVALDLAKIDVGPIYFNIDPPNTTDFRSGVVIMESLRQVTVNLLDPTLYPVEGGAQGETGTATAVEIDLLPPDSTISDPDVGGPSGQSFAVLAGVASRTEGDGGVQVPFKGWITLSAADATDTSPLPWLQRVNGATCSLDFTTGSGQLTMRIDPTGWFDRAEFIGLLPTSAAQDGGTPDGGALDGGAGSGPFGWGDPSDFNASVLNQMQSTVGVYTFDLAAGG